MKTKVRFNPTTMTIKELAECSDAILMILEAYRREVGVTGSFSQSHAHALVSRIVDNFESA